MSFDWLTALQELKQKAIPVAMVTIIKTKGSTPRDIGTKMLVSEKDFFGTIGGGQLEELVIAKARDILKGPQQAERVPYPLCIKANQCCGGFVEVFIETINTGAHLILFGAGHVSQAIARVLEGSPFQMHMVDSRQEWLDKAPAGIIKHNDQGLNFIDQWTQWNSTNTYAAVMTFDHDLDQDLIEKLASKNTKYLGLIGSQTKWQRFHKRLLEKGVSAELLQKVICPIGLSIGGKSPAEVAISFAAEIIQLHNKEQVKVTQPEEPWTEELL
jgi:xanthine dehydrogenase accessory factor